MAEFIFEVAHSGDLMSITSIAGEFTEKAVVDVCANRDNFDAALLKVVNGFAQLVSISGIPISRDASINGDNRAFSAVVSVSVEPFACDIECRRHIVAASGFELLNCFEETLRVVA